MGESICAVMCVHCLQPLCSVGVRGLALGYHCNSCTVITESRLQHKRILVPLLGTETAAKLAIVPLKN